MFVISPKESDPIYLTRAEWYKARKWLVGWYVGYVVEQGTISIREASLCGNKVSLPAGKQPNLLFFECQWKLAVQLLNPKCRPITQRPNCVKIAEGIKFFSLFWNCWKTEQKMSQAYVR